MSPRRAGLGIFLIWQVGTVVSECKLPIEVDEYVETFSPILVDLVHAW